MRLFNLLNTLSIYIYASAILSQTHRRFGNDRKRSKVVQGNRHKLTIFEFINTSPFEVQKDDSERTHVVLDENNIETKSNEVHDNSKEEVTNDSKIGMHDIYE